MPERVHGRRHVYGVPLGMLMTESRFPRLPGDNGNAGTWPFPVLYRVVPGAGPGRVVRELDEGSLLGPFIEAAEELQDAGVEVITTSCGFLVLYQQQLQRRLRVPFLSSSLLQVPWIARLLPPGGHVGILTIERGSLTDAHLLAAGIHPDLDVRIVGLDEVGGYFTDAILSDRPELDVERARREHEDAVRLLLERHPDVRAIVLECTNMPPYASAVRRITGLPTYDLRSLVTWGVMAAPSTEPDG